MPPEGQVQDVNTADPGSSPDQGVTAASPTAPDVNAPDPSTGDKSHEDMVPYNRFREALEKAKVLEEKINVLESQQQSAPQPQPTQQPQQPQQQPQQDFDWFGIDPNASPQTQQPLSVNEEIEKRVREEMYDRPVTTLAPIINEIVSQALQEQRRRENQVKRIPDFQKYEAQFYGIPDNLVSQVQQNPETIRFLLAKHQATIDPRTPMVNFPNAQNPNVSQPQPQPQPNPGNGGQQPIAQTFDDLKKQWMEEGRRQALGQVRTTQGIQAEGGTTISSGVGDKFELDEAGKAQMRMIGIPESEWEAVAKRAEAEERKNNLR